MKVSWQKHVTEGSPFIQGGFAQGYNFVVVFPEDEKERFEELIDECATASVIKRSRIFNVQKPWHTWVVVVTDSDDAMMFKLLVN